MKETKKEESNMKERRTKVREEGKRRKTKDRKKE